MNNTRLISLLSAAAACALALSSCSATDSADGAESAKAKSSTQQEASQSDKDSSKDKDQAEAPKAAEKNTSEGSSALSPQSREFAVKGCVNTGQNEAYCGCLIDELASKYDEAGFLDLSKRLMEKEDAALKEALDAGLSCLEYMGPPQPAPAPTGNGASDSPTTPGGYVKPAGIDWPDHAIDAFISSCQAQGATLEDCHCAAGVTMGQVPYAETPSFFTNTARKEQLRRDIVNTCKKN